MTAAQPLAIARPVTLTREGTVFRLAFRYQESLVARARELPYAFFDREETQTWTCLVCAQSVEALRQWHYEGLCDVSADALIAADETLVVCKDALLRRGTLRRPYYVATARRDDSLYAKLKAVPGGSWVKGAGALSYPPHAAPALAELVDRGIIDDPDGLITPAGVTVAFDMRTGRFVIRGDHRAERAFTKYFPERDVVSEWQERELDVAFADTFSEEVYHGELARLGEGIQPEGLLLPLYQHQAQNVAIAIARNGFLVADVPGVGKTMTAIATGFELLKRGEIGRVVVVVPGAIRSQWQEEILRFTGHEDVVVIDGSKQKRAAGYEAAKTARWIVVHYDVLHRDEPLFLPLCVGALVVADEAHRLKTHTSQRAKMMRKAGQRSSHRLGLTGTPVLNAPDELYSVLSGFLVPGCLGAPQEFLSRYMYPNPWGGYTGSKNLPELNSRVKVHFIRHTKAEVAPNLPPLTVERLVLDPEPAYASALRRAHREARKELMEVAAAWAEKKAKKAGGADAVLSGNYYDEAAGQAEMNATGMLRLLCSSPRCVQASDSDTARALIDAGIIPDQDGPKLDALRELASEMQSAGDRLVIFTFSRRMADLIGERFATDGIRHVLFTGETSTEQRKAAVKAFTTAATDTDPGPTCFISTDAGAEGLNLGKCCSTLVNVDLPWTPGTLTQRSQRIHRIDGTHDKYMVINMILAGTIETGIFRLLEAKAEVADAILGEKEAARSVGKGRAIKRHQPLIFDAMENWAAEANAKT